ncbi:MAG TPA: hypothetical protein VGU65_07145 [Frateuria sp.]|uniref:hypothetical protein n=1 Tax=Frateuria sp. TaxID=2211372 RepID=UPI002DE3B4EF|nr:hypothetical protein [Frateuria sp.]
MSTHRCDRYTELGPYIAWLSKINDGEYTIVIQIADHPPECADAPFETEEQALQAADVFAHQLQQSARGATLAGQAGP